MIPQFLRTESYNRGIAYSVFFNMLSKATAFLASLAIAFYFGTNAQTDVYFYALFVVGIIVGFVSNLNASVIIPESMRLYEQEGVQSSTAFVNLFLYAYAAIGLAATVAMLASPAASFALISRFDKHLLASNTRILYCILPLLASMLMLNFLTDVLTSKKFFTTPMLTGIVNSLFVLGFVVIFHGKYGVSSAAIGLSLAYFIQAVFLILLMRRILNWDFVFKRTVLGGRIWKNMLFTQLGSLSSVLAASVPMYLISGLGSGVISALNYGKQVSELPNSVITSQFSSVAGIKFNEQHAQKNYEETNRVFLAAARFLLFILVPVSFAGFAYSREIMTLLFKRGTFDAAATALSAKFLRFFVLSLPFYGISTLMARIFMAGQKIRESFWFQVLYNLLLVTVIYGCVSKFGGLGYPLALLIMNLFGALFYIYLTRAFFPYIHYVKALDYFSKIAALNLALILPIAYGTNLIGSPFLRLAVGSAVYGGLILYLNHRLGFNADMNTVLKKIRGASSYDFRPSS